MNTLSSQPTQPPVEALRVAQDLTYNWQYDDTRARLMRLYENAKRDQWNSTTRLDWSIDVDPRVGAGARHGHRHLRQRRYGRRSPPGERERLRHEAITWQLSQFLHGEQGALLATAQIVDAVPWYEGKQYGATQVMDEARHVEVYRRFVQEKLQHEYPVNPELKKLLDLILSDSRWDFKFLGMQIMVEGLALAAFGVIRDTATNPLLRDLTAAVMEDESRHVAFGVLSLREHLADLDERGARRARGLRLRGRRVDARPPHQPRGLGAMGLDADAVRRDRAASRRSPRSSAAASSPRSSPT